jgi:outer membrane immunogenic protein
MKRLGLAVLALAALTSSGLAADMAVKAPPYQAPVATTYNWSGFYGGGSLGLEWETVDGNYGPVGFPQDHHNETQSRALYGGFAGVQWQWTNIVIGAEVSYSNPFNNSFGKSVGGSNDCIITSVPTFWCEARINDLFTAGSRLGWAYNRWMLYGTGGYAEGRLESRFEIIATGVVSDDVSTRNHGWYAGGGVDYAISIPQMPDLILGLEYRHIDLQTQRQFDAGNTRDMSGAEDIVDLRLAVKFNAWNGSR